MITGVVKRALRGGATTAGSRDGEQDRDGWWSSSGVDSGRERRDSRRSLYSLACCFLTIAGAVWNVIFQAFLSTGSQRAAQTSFNQIKPTINAVRDIPAAEAHGRK